MSTVAAPVSGFEGLFAAWRDIEFEPGWRVEISEGAIRMSAMSSGRHSKIASFLDGFLRPHCPHGFSVFQSVGVKIGDAEKLYVPDIVVTPVDALDERSLIGPADALLTVEITSPSNARVDREEKLGAYAEGGVPTYLLVDVVSPTGPGTTLFSDPVRGVYQRVIQQPFGGVIQLPPPFDVELDTSQFPA